MCIRRGNFAIHCRCTFAYINSNRRKTDKRQNPHWGQFAERVRKKNSEKRIEMRIFIASALIGMLVAWKLMIIGGNEVINFFAEHLEESEKANSEANADVMDVVYVICCQPTQYMILGPGETEARDQQFFAKTPLRMVEMVKATVKQDTNESVQTGGVTNASTTQHANNLIILAQFCGKN